MAERWVRLLIPTTDLDLRILGRKPYVLDEAPRGLGREVRLATEQETGLFGYRALPRPREVAGG